MIVSLTQGAATIVEPEDFSRLHVATVLLPEEVNAALRKTGIGTTSTDGRILLDIEALRSAAEAASASPQWSQGWSKMIDYAQTRQWVSPDGCGVWAHVEYLPKSAE